MDRSREGTAVAAAVGLLLVAASLVLGVAAVGTGASADAAPSLAPAPAESEGDTAFAVRQTADNDSESPARLDLGDGTRVSDAGTPTASLGTAVSVGDEGLRVRLDRYRARQLLADADTGEQRRAAVRRILNVTDDAAQRLRQRETAAVRAYHAGDIDREELLHRLARLQVVAGEYRRALAEVRTRADDAVTFDLDTQISTTDRRLAAHQSPVREQVAAGLAGREAASVRVTATESGLALETVVGGQYVRDVVRLDRYAPGEGDRLETPPEVAERLRVLYPYAFPRAPSNAISTVSDRLFLAEFPHPQGQVRVYLNRDTGAAYREVQWLQLGQVPTTAVRNVSEGGVRVVVERVDGRNPTLVRVTDASTDQPLAATVNGSDVTATTTGGELWLALGPAPTTLTVETDRGTVNVTVGAGSDPAPATRSSASRAPAGASVVGVDVGTGPGAGVRLGVGPDVGVTLR